MHERPSATGCLTQEDVWQGKKDSNLRMPESKSGALTNLATPLHRSFVENKQPYNLLSETQLKSG